MLTMSEVKQRNRNHGHHWFDPSSMRFFRSRAGDTVYGDKYFISSEQFDTQSPRLYSIRQVSLDGRIDTVGEFQGYSSHSAAKRGIDRLLKSV